MDLRASGCQSRNIAIATGRKFKHPWPLVAVSKRGYERSRKYERQMADSGDDGLPLLLAINRVAQTTRRDAFANDDDGNGEYRADADDSESEINEPLGVAFAVW